MTGRSGSNPLRSAMADAAGAANTPNPNADDAAAPVRAFPPRPALTAQGLDNVLTRLLLEVMHQ